MTEKEFKETRYLLTKFLEYLQFENKLPLYNFTHGTIATNFLNTILKDTNKDGI